MLSLPLCSLGLMMATPAGFEPATIRLEGECSIQLSYGVVAPSLATFAFIRDSDMFVAHGG